MRWAVQRWERQKDAALPRVSCPPPRCTRRSTAPHMQHLLALRLGALHGSKCEKHEHGSEQELTRGHNDG